MHSPVKWAAMVACVLLSIATAGAVPVTYDFVAGSSITWQHCSAGMCGGAGPTDAVSGSFSYDATTTDMSAVNVVLSGAGVGGADGTYNIFVNPEGPTNFAVFDTTGGFVTLVFTTPLSGVPASLDSSVGAEQFCFGCGGGGATPSFAASGGLIPVSTPAPEPSTLGIFLGACLLSLMLRSGQKTRIMR